MGISVETLAVAKKYTNRSIEGITGSLAGKNATIDSITNITGGHRVTFKWTADNGDVRTQTMDVMDGAKGDKGETGDAGLGIKAVNINAQSHLIITYDDDSTYDAGELPGGSGEVISVNGKKGAVTLDANDVGALPDDTELFSGDYNDLDNLPDLTNFITNTVDNLVNYYKKTETYTKTEVDNIANTIKNGRFEAVATLPTTDIKTNVIYLVPKSTAQASNIKDEYINLDGTTAGWEKIGDTEIDLSGYVTTTALNTALAAYTTTTDLTALLADKVDKVTGKGLSTNDYTNTDKELVDSIPTLAPISLVKDTVGWTGKNLLKNTATSQTINGVTFTVNADKSVTVNGTATADAVFVIHDRATDDLNISSGNYIGSGITNGVSGKQYMRFFCTRNGSAYVYGDIFNGEITISVQSGDIVGCLINIASGQTVNNLTFYPMIRKADITDPTYEPYHESVEVMYEEEIHGVNLLTLEACFSSVDGVTRTINSDNSVTINGTATNNNNVYFSQRHTKGAITLDAGRYIFSVGASIPSTCRLHVSYSAIDGSNVVVAYGDYGANTITFDAPIKDRPWNVLMEVKKDANFNNLKLYPMIRKADIEDSTYRPYNPQAIQNQLNAQGVLGAKNLLENVGSTVTQSGITATYNSDGSILLNGTATATIGLVVSKDVSDNNFLPNGKYILSGSAVFSDNCYLWINKYVSGSGSSLVQLKTSGEVEFAIDTSQYDGIKVGITIRNGATLSNLLVKPMIRLASDPDDTYQPYVMTNRELTEYNKGFNFLKFLFNADGSDIYSGNLNDLHAGYVYYSNTAVNIPANYYGYCITLERPSSYNYAVQIAINATGDSVNMYVRKKVNHTWEAWKTVTMS